MHGRGRDRNVVQDLRHRLPQRQLRRAIGIEWHHDGVAGEHFRTGAQLRALPNPPIGPDRDLFEVVPGGSDEKIADTQEVKMRDGLRFFTAPAQINPGSI